MGSELLLLINIIRKWSHPLLTALEKFNSENAIDEKSFIWPRHADGSCEYEDNKKTISISVTNVTVNKLMSVSENLKLRSGEATSSQVLTVMSAGTKVKILEIGKEEIIDGIKSNWVKVEIQSGKDKEGKELRCGMAGWCYGGYLQ